MQVQRLFELAGCQSLFFGQQGEKGRSRRLSTIFWTPKKPFYPFEECPRGEGSVEWFVVIVLNEVVEVANNAKCETGKVAQNPRNKHIEPGGDESGLCSQKGGLLFQSPEFGRENGQILRKTTC